MVVGVDPFKTFTIQYMGYGATVGGSDSNSSSMH